MPLATFHSRLIAAIAGLAACLLPGCERQAESQSGKQANSEQTMPPTPLRQVLASSPPAPRTGQTKEPRSNVQPGFAVADGDSAPRSDDLSSEAGDLIAQTSAFYSESDPEAGLAWAKSFAAPRQRQAALESLAWACAETNLGFSVQAMEQLTSGDAKSRLAAHVAGQWAAIDIEAAEAWAVSRPDAAERMEALAAFSTAIAEQFPVQAAALISEKMHSGASRDRAVVAVIQRWVQTDLSAAKQWIASFPDAPLKHAAMAVIDGTLPPNPHQPSQNIPPSR